MHADLSRVTYRADRHYSAVIAQQGRVQLDADINEQTLIHLLGQRRLVADLIGPHGGPCGAAGFQITHVAGKGAPDDLIIGGGHYYVAGIACDAHRPAPGTPVPEGPPGDTAAPSQPQGSPPRHWTFWDQPNGFLDQDRADHRLPADFPYLVHLQVWERSVTAVEDPALREVALGPALPDTTARVKVVWQVRALPAAELDLDGDATPDALREAFTAWARRAQASGARMAARGARPEQADDDPCLVKPDARYRGPENQLYRVEVHAGGRGDEATIKWSRENGSVVFAVDRLDGTWVELATLGGDEKLDLNVGDWVEVVDTAYASRGEPLPLLRVEDVDAPARRVRLSGEPHPSVGRRPDLHPFLRRWDHRGGGRRGWARLRGGAVRVREGEWLPLEDGVEIYFAAGGEYRTGEFWLFPARTVTGDVEWPRDAARRPLLKGPLGPAVRYAPLAWVTGPGAQTDLRLTFPPLTERAAAPAPSTADQVAGSASEAATGTGADAAAGASVESGAASAPKRRPRGRRRTKAEADEGAELTQEQREDQEEEAARATNRKTARGGTRRAK